MYCATSHQNNLPYHAMSEARDSFRAIAAALTSEASLRGIAGQPITVTVNGFTVTTTTPIECAGKYIKAAKRAIKRSNKAPGYKWTPADEKHYTRINGTGTEEQAPLFDEEPTADTADTDTDTADFHANLPSNKAMTTPATKQEAMTAEEYKAQHDIKTARAAMKEQAAAIATSYPVQSEEDDNAELLAALLAEQEAPAMRSVAKAERVLDTLAELATPAPVKPAVIVRRAAAPRTKPAKTKRIESDYTYKASFSQLAETNDTAESAERVTLARLSAQFDRAIPANPLAQLAAQYDVTTESAERDTLSALASQFAPMDIPATPAPIQAEATPATPAPIATPATPIQLPAINWSPIKRALKRITHNRHRWTIAAMVLVSFAVIV